MARGRAEVGLEHATASAKAKITFTQRAIVSDVLLDLVYEQRAPCKFSPQR